MRLRNITMIAFLSLLFTGGLFAQTFYTEDFADGIPSDWTSVEVEGNGTASASWFHTTTGPSADYLPALTSPSDDNGWMIFDSDLNNNEGNTQDAWLISPEIDATNQTEVWLQFESMYRSYLDRPQIRVGTDINDLSNWDGVVVFPNVQPTFYAPENIQSTQLVSVNLTNLAAGSTFRFAFQFLSNDETGQASGMHGWAYAWQLDDVVLTNINPLDPDEIRVNDFFAIAPNMRTPKSQVEPIIFMADIENVGSTVIDASTLDIDIQDNLGNLVFNSQLLYPSFPTGTLMENTPFDEQFTPPAETEIYQGTYVLAPVDVTDSNPANNEKVFNFAITDTIFSKASANSQLRSVNPNSTVGTNYSYGPIFYTPNGEGMYARYVQFGVMDASELTGKSVTFYLYQWIGDENDDDVVNETEFVDSPDGVNYFAVNEYTFDGTEGGDLLTIPIDLNGVGIPLSDDAHYYLCLIWDDTETTFPLMGSEEQDYGSMQFITELQGASRYTYALRTTNSPNFNLFGYGTDLVPFVNMTIGDNPDLDGPALVSTREIILAEGTVSVFPNPANETASIKFDLGETSDNVTVELFDVAGKLVKTAQYENVLNNTVTLDVKNLVNGAYLLQARTDKGIRTVNVTVQH